jgi:hypothetical protein
LSDQRRARTTYDKLSPEGKRLMARAGLNIMRGGPRSKELSNLSETTESNPRGKVLRVTRIDPEKAKSSDELVRFGLAYVPSQSDKDKLGYVALTRLGESAAVLAAKSTFGPSAEADALKLSVLDKTSASLSEALFHLEDAVREDRFRRFNPRERRALKGLARMAHSLQAEVNAFRDGFRPDREEPPDTRSPMEGSDRSRVTRPQRS